jgi:putative acetyltransferase
MNVVVSPADVDSVVASGLLAELDADLLSRYPGEPINGIQPGEFRLTGGYFVLAHADADLSGCGAFRPYSRTTVEIKRMYVRAAFRGKGIAGAMIKALEAEAREQGFVESILETAVRMPEAIALYRSCGYQVIEPYGQFVGSARSVCMRSAL